MSTTHINGDGSSSSSSSSSSSRSRGRSRSHSGSKSCAHIQRQTTHVVGLRQQLLHLGRRLGKVATPSSGHGSISTILIVNLLMLLLLSLCCDVCCRSHADPSPNINLNNSAAAAAAAAAAAETLSNMRPTLDSDVVEKVAVWTKHVGAAPPSVAEGIAISSIARARVPVTSNLNTATQSNRRQQPDSKKKEQQQKQVQDANADDAAGADERILLERVTRDCVQRCIVEVSVIRPHPTREYTIYPA